MRITPFLGLFIRSKQSTITSSSTKPIRRMNERDILIVRFIMSVCTLAMTMTDAKPRRIAMHITNKYRTLCPVPRLMWPLRRLPLGWVSKMHRDRGTLRLIKFHRVMRRLLFFSRWKTLCSTRGQIVKVNESAPTSAHQRERILRSFKLKSFQWKIKSSRVNLYILQWITFFLRLKFASNYFFQNLLLNRKKVWRINPNQSKLKITRDSSINFVFQGHVSTLLNVASTLLRWIE